MKEDTKDLVTGICIGLILAVVILVFGEALGIALFGR